MPKRDSRGRFSSLGIAGKLGGAKGSVKRGELAGTLARARAINAGRAAKGKAPLSAARLKKVAVHVQQKARLSAVTQFNFDKRINRGLPKADRSPASARRFGWSAPEAYSVDRRRELTEKRGRLRPGSY